MKETLALTLALFFAVLCAAWVTVFPTIGLLWCVGWLR